MSVLLEPLPTLDEICAERCRRSLSYYIKQAWSVIEPSTTYLHNWHIDAIAEYLTAVSLGQIRRLLINIPPRYMKSISVSVMWPTWSWINNPASRWIFASYSQSLSTKHSVDRRTILQSDWYRKHWGHIFSMTSDQNVKTEYQNDKRGVMVATSVGGTVIGKGGDYIIVDDPHNPMEAQSDVQREAAITFFDQSLSTRLDNKKTGAIVVIMQRLHERDLSGHILARGGYEHLCLPAEAERKTIIMMPLSKCHVEREEGALLWMEREGFEEIAEQKRTLGSYAFAGQYQQRPSPAEGGIIKRHWWKFWHHPEHPLPPVTVKSPEGELLNISPSPLPVTFDQVAQSWDMAFKDTQHSAYVVGQVWGRMGADKYLLDQRRDKLDFVATIIAVKRLSHKWPQAIAKWVEDKANGPAVIAALRREIPGLIPIEPEGSKESRVHATSPEIEAGNIYLPHPGIAPWVWEFIEECASFPNGEYADQVDAMTQALIRWRKQMPSRVRAKSSG